MKKKTKKVAAKKTATNATAPKLATAVTERVFVVLCDDGEMTLMRAEEDKVDELLAFFAADKMLKFGKTLWEVEPGRDIKFLGEAD